MATSFNLKTGAEDVHFTAESSHRESDPEADKSDNVDAVNEATNEDEPSSKSSSLLEQSVLRSSCRLSLERPMTTTIFRDLPNDLVEEVLCFVPATYLKRLKSTCKRWNRLFSGDCRFAREHTDKAAKQFLVLLVKESRICPTIINLHGSVEFKNELSLVDSQSMVSAQFDISEASHCDGLLLCTCRASRFVVWNPFTGETRWLQPSTRGTRWRNKFVLGYYQEDNVKSYKILSKLSLGNDFEIYEFSSDSWRTLGDIIPPGWRNYFCDTLRVFLKGNAYWFADTKVGIMSLLKFDFQTEKCVPVPLPYHCRHFESRGLSVVRDEKLSVLLQQDVTSKTEIWVTSKIDETIQVVSWSKVLALDLCPDLQICDDVNFVFDEEKKVVMMIVRWIWVEMEDDGDEVIHGKDMLYTVGEDDEVTQVELGEDDRCIPLILNYVPSWVQIEQAGRGKRKRGD